MKKKLMRIRWLWAIMGFQLLAVGFAIFYNAESDQYLYPAFATFSKPLWVYLPFIIGMLAIYCGISTRSHKKIESVVLYSMTMYWGILTTLLFMNDSYHSHISIIGFMTVFYIPVIWLMAFQTKR